MLRMFFQVFCLFQHISLDLISLGSAETNVGWGGQLNSRLMASCVRNICAKNYQNLLIGFQATVENVEDVFLRHSVYELYEFLALV